MDRNRVRVLSLAGMDAAAIATGLNEAVEDVEAELDAIRERFTPKGDATEERARQLAELESIRQPTVRFLAGFRWGSDDARPSEFFQGSRLLLQVQQREAQLLAIDGQPYAGVIGPQEAAATATVEAMRSTGLLEPIDTATVEATIGLARAIDRDVTNPELWESYHSARVELMSRHDPNQDAYAAAVADIRALE